MMPDAEQFQRLPLYISPKNYKVSLFPDLVACTFEGDVLIDIEIHEPTKEIVLNSLDLEIENISLVRNEESFKPSTFSLDVSKEILTILFTSEISPGSAKLNINFKGILNDKLKGFYRNKYTIGSEVRYGAVTQFEATDARRCFPCWDEPAIKATFDVVLTVPVNKVALSNMNVVSTDPHPTDETLHIIKFAKTPVMPSYLLAVVVGDYDFVEQILPNGTIIRVYTPVSKQEQGLFALEVASKVLPYYNNYFQIDYPLPKMDLIAVSDMSMGAMENWGLIIYRETLLLVDPHNTSANHKQNIALVVAHEIAHQWFGNLVTMEWWTDLWLKEGYASFCEYLCIDELLPEYDVWTQFVTDTYISGLELDALRNSHPIEVPVENPSKIEEIYDQISYNKGASLIRTMHSYIGDEDFRKGMTLYLNRHKYGNTTTKDLWTALSEASGKEIAKLMASWTEKMGFPMVTVTSHQNHNNRVLTLTQKRFIADGSPDEKNQEWVIPISIRTSKKSSKLAKDFVLDSKTSKVVLEDVSEDDWIKINVNSVGFYRTQYPPEMLNLLRQPISAKVLPPLDRLGVIDDLFAMMQAGYSSTVDVLKFLKGYEEETNYTVWASIHNITAQINQLVSHTSFQPLYQTFIRKILSKIFIKTGWDSKPNESHLDTLLRSLVLQRLGTYGEESVFEDAKKRFFAHVNGTQKIPADLRSAVYRTVMSRASETFFTQMLQLYRETDLHEEKIRLCTSFGASKNPNIIQKTLQFAMSDEVRSQDFVFVIIGVSYSKIGREAAWAFFKANINDLKKKIEGGNLFARLIISITENFASEEMASEVEEFFKDKQILGTERSIQQAVECIRLNSAWLKRDSESLGKFLREEVS